MCGRMYGRVCVFFRAKTDTFFVCFFLCSSSKVLRLEVQPAPESESLPDPQRVDEFADAEEGVEDFLGDADEGAEDDADDQPEVFNPPETLSPQSRPSLTQ